MVGQGGKVKAELPFVCKSPINSGGLHWTKRRKLQERAAEYLFAAWGKSEPPSERRTMTITLHRPPHHAMDRDNAYASVQPVVNAVKKLGHLRDDSEEWLDLIVRQADDKKRWTEVEINV